MINKNLFLYSTGANLYLFDDEDPDRATLFNESLNTTAENAYVLPGIYYNIIPLVYGRWYSFTNTGLDNNLLYDIYHNGRYHTLFRGLKYYLNVSDLWYMNAILIGFNFKGTNPIEQKSVAGVSQQSFANINLGVDAMYLALNKLMPAGKEISQDLFEAEETGIRLVIFVDKLDLVERTLAGGKKVNNLQFHYTIKAYLIDSSLGGQYEDFTNASLLGQKSFYYEQTVPTYKRSNFSTKQSLKTGWGHFIYPATTSDSTAIKYLQLSDVLKTIYNSMIFSQSTNNASLQVDSSSLSAWLNTDITLKNARHNYEPSSVTPKQNAIPTFGFTDKNVMKDWLLEISNKAVAKGSSADYLLSYDNIYWEPLADLFYGDVYSNSPAMFMTRLTTYYQGPGQSPVDEPGNFENPGGFIKNRRKYFLYNLIKFVADDYKTRQEYSDGDEIRISTYLATNEPEKLLGSKFFPFYKFLQYKDVPSQKELLDLITIPFSGAQTTQNVIECETSVPLKAVTSENLNQYRRKIITKPGILPASLGYSATERINSIGYVTYIHDDGRIETISLDLNAGIFKNYVFAFLTWIFLNPPLVTGAREWTRDGRYLTYANRLDTPNLFGSGITSYAWKGKLDLCTVMQSGMYDTPEIAYKEFKRVENGIYVTSDPSPTDPEWKDYFACLPSVERTETTTEYCDPSPALDSRPVVKRIVKQKVAVAANGNKVNIGDPTYEYPSTTIVLKNHVKVINGKNVTGDRTIVYQNCSTISDNFVPYQIAPTGPVINTGPKKEVDVSLETFINPAIFKRNIITMLPSNEVIPIITEKCYYVFDFDSQDIGDSSSKYTITLSPGTNGQVLILEVNTIGTPYKGVLLVNGSSLSGNSSSQKVRLSTDTWGDGGGQRFKSLLFMIFNGNDWVEFLRRDIY